MYNTGSAHVGVLSGATITSMMCGNSACTDCYNTMCFTPPSLGEWSVCHSDNVSGTNSGYGAYRDSRLNLQRPNWVRWRPRHHAMRKFPPQRPCAAVNSRIMCGGRECPSRVTRKWIISIPRGHGLLAKNRKHVSRNHF
jgi:hypothetical protein